MDRKYDHNDGFDGIRRVLDDILDMRPAIERRLAELEDAESDPNPKLSDPERQDELTNQP